MIPHNIYLYDTTVLNPDISEKDRADIDKLEEEILLILEGQSIIEKFCANQKVIDAVYAAMDHYLTATHIALSVLARRYPVDIERVYKRMDTFGLWWSPSPSYYPPRRCGYNGCEIIYNYEI